MQFIGTSREGLGHILADNRVFVPTYQRSFAWKRRHVDALLADLAGAIRKKSDNRTQDYFLGSVVAISREKRLEIVDGQQRLATTSLILTAIRDQFLAINDKEMAKSIDAEYLRRFNMRTRESPARMELNEDDNGFYQNWALVWPNERKVAEQPQRQSHRRIANAYRAATRYFRGLWGQYNKSDTTELLIEWVDFLREHAQVIRVTVNDAADAYVIFETLNDRGLELSTSDLLKNYLFGRSGERVEETKKRWARMVGALDTVGNKEVTVDYIRQLWGSQYGLTRKRELFYKIKEEVSNQRAALQFSTSLDENAQLYAAILNPSHSTWVKYGPAARNAISTIRFLRVERLRPLLLSILAAFSSGEVKRVLQWLVSASVRLNVTGGGSSGPTEKALADAAVKIREGEITDASALASELTSGRAVIPSDSVFEKAFAVARVSNPQMARYYLRTLEEAFVGNDEPHALPDNENVLNLEHIFPEKGRDVSWNHVPAEKANELCYRIGNMTLLNPKVNSQLESRSFVDKVAAYAKSNNTRLTQELARRYLLVDKWGEDQINEWQAVLAKLATKAWSLEVKGKGKRKVRQSNPSGKRSASGLLPKKRTRG